MEIGTQFYEAAREMFPGKHIYFIYRGLSGTSPGSAILFAAGMYDDDKVHGAYIRKDSEKGSCHGEMIETEFPYQLKNNLQKFFTKQCVFIIVDDFSESGDTVHALCSKFSEYLSLYEGRKPEYQIMFRECGKAGLKSLIRDGQRYTFGLVWQSHMWNSTGKPDREWKSIEQRIAGIDEYMRMW